MKTDYNFKMIRYMRTRVYNAFKSQSVGKTQHISEYLDCTKEFFKEWIAFQLTDEMTTENYGEVWHIDHVKPCVSYNLNDEE